MLCVVGNALIQVKQRTHIFKCVTRTQLQSYHNNKQRSMRSSEFHCLHEISWISAVLRCSSAEFVDHTPSTGTASPQAISTAIQWEQIKACVFYTFQLAYIPASSSAVENGQGIVSCVKWYSNQRTYKTEMHHCMETRKKQRDELSLPCTYHHL